MKYVVILGDGMADYRKGPLGFRTPLDLAKKPNIDALAKAGTVGLIRTVDSGLKPGSDVANLSVIGYDATKSYTGRSPLEALSLKIPVNDEDAVLRMNFVTLKRAEGEPFSAAIMDDYSAGEITTEESHLLVGAIQASLGSDKITFYGGTGYRNCAVLPNCAHKTAELTPPHDILDKNVASYLPKGELGDFLLSVMEQTADILKDHPVNAERRKNGKKTADAAWFWGLGTKPVLESFTQKYNLTGAVISAVDLLKGIAIAAGMDVIEVDGATGNLNTNFVGKAQACLEALKTHDYVYVHMEAPDECGHQGDPQGKIAAIEKVDMVTGLIVDGLRETGEDFCIAVLPDHATPLILRTHVSDPVPYLVYNSLRPTSSGLVFNEEEAQKGLYLNNGRSLIKLMLRS